MHRKKSEQTNPNLKLMLTFSICNLVLDGVNVFSFAKAKHLFGFSIGDDIKYDTTGNESSSVSKEAESKLTSPQQQFSDNRRAGFSDSSEGNNPTLACDNGVFDSAQHHFGDEPSNLNMCSAFTHVFADTLRSLAVILAAGTAEAVPRVTPEEADATAAVVVSILIALSLVPLFRGVCKSVAEYQSISVEERFEVTAERPANEIDVA
jgi:Co/Zn/Cd efflux system component